MQDKDFLISIKNSIRKELNEAADIEIEKLVYLFRCELEEQKPKIITNMIDQIEVLLSKNHIENSTTIQINIRGADNG